ncbi:unnamed protein product [Adineta steineri]|uniref:G-protein coupled receptors family 1 profile domain-containing protein n=1 Tax=Adineta steineri TaxID=433720 RepID=A0A813XCV2_9BILA|nr:unnamed protein product [Adineta steineri]CAF0868793.1 unnamed protein product [Adineta steineri]
MITINRFLTIKYPNKRFFQRRTWPFISSGIQWIISILIPVPYLIYLVEGCARQEQTPYWLQIYSFVIFIIVPLILNAISNSLIFITVRSSSRRVAQAVAATTGPTAKINHSSSRDTRLLKHMLFIFVAYIIGWLPVSCILLLNVDVYVNLTVSQFLRLLPVISSFITIFDLFFYNRDLTKYLTENFFKYLHIK